MKNLNYSLVLFALIFSLATRAEEIKFPEEELAKETVLPKFDRFEATKNRNVITAKKFEMAGYLGWNFTEPIFNQMKYGMNLDYHLNEDSALNLNAAFWAPGLNSQYADGISKASGGLDFTRAPGPQYSVYGHYALNAYYGKMSLTKLTTMNLVLYPLFGAGMTQYRNKMYPGFDGGLGFKFYFNNRFSIRTDFKLQMAQSPVPFLKGYMLPGQPVPNDSQFTEKWAIATIFDLGVSYLF